MADITISQLANTVPTTNSILPISKNGVTQSTTLAQLSSLPFIPKAWARFTGTGTIGQNQTIIASYNVSSVIRLTENNYVVNFPAGVFSNGNYSFYGMSGTSTNRASFISGPLLDEPTATAFKFGSFSLTYTGEPAGIINEAGQYINIMFFAN